MNRRSTRHQAPGTRHQKEHQAPGFLLVLIALCAFGQQASAQELTILYTGSTHAMLYPCHCPKEPDGGIARRATLVKQLRKKDSNILLLDSGSFFAGGILDEQSGNIELDAGRSRTMVSAMKIMRYDAAVVQAEEFSFGEDFLYRAISIAGFTFLSSNLISEQISPYTIRELAGVKVGIIGVTSSRASNKVNAIKYLKPPAAVRQAVAELKKKNTDIIILLGALDESEEAQLLEAVEGIDIFVSGYSRDKEKAATRIGDTLIVRPSWQGRRLGKLTLTLKGNKIDNYKTQELRLSDKLRDDPDILKALPRCFSEDDCRKKGFLGRCENPGTMQARCAFSRPQAVRLRVILPKDCRVCKAQDIVNYLQAYFLALDIVYLYYPDAPARKLIQELGINGLPAYILGKEIEKEEKFANLKARLEKRGEAYLVRPQFSGTAYFLNREKIKGRFDVFINLYGRDTEKLLGAIRDFNPELHFLAQKGTPEAEECLRSLCVKKYYPQKFWDYLACRAKNAQSSWWEDCAGGMEKEKIKSCSRSEEGSTLFKENTKLSDELGINTGPVYFLDNVEAFGIEGLPSREGLKKIIKR